MQKSSQYTRQVEQQVSDMGLPSLCPTQVLSSFPNKAIVSLGQTLNTIKIAPNEPNAKRTTVMNFKFRTAVPLLIITNISSNIIICRPFDALG